MSETHCATCLPMALVLTLKISTVRKILNEPFDRISEKYLKVIDECTFTVGVKPIQDG